MCTFLYNKMTNCTECSAVSVYWATIPKFQPTKIFKFNLQFSHPFWRICISVHRDWQQQRVFAWFIEDQSFTLSYDLVIWLLPHSLPSATHRKTEKRDNLLTGGFGNEPNHTKKRRESLILYKSIPFNTLWAAVCWPLQFYSQLFFSYIVNLTTFALTTLSFVSLSYSSSILMMIYILF